MRVLRLVITMLLALHATPLLAVQPDEILPDAKLEERARNLSRELRCMVCQNQSIDDSDAPLARDLRLLVRSHHHDPRTGDVEYRLANIVRAEPSADLFTIPSDYTVLGDTLNAVPGVRTGGPGAGAGTGGGGGRGVRQGGTPAN